MAIGNLLKRVAANKQGPGSPGDNIFSALTVRQTVGELPVYVDPIVSPAEGHNQSAGIKTVNSRRRLVLALLWPIFNLRNWLFVDGFIERWAGRRISRLTDSSVIFLEVGCGNTELSKYLPRRVRYNAFDISLSEFHLRRLQKRRPDSNLALASATRIPVKSKSIDVAVATEVLEHIPEVESAVREIRRVLRDEGRLICTIPNNYCTKYIRKGPHPGHINNWSFEGFVDFMHEQGFEVIESDRLGYWLPIPTWITKTSFQIPLRPRTESSTTNFFFVFGVKQHEDLSLSQLPTPSGL